MLDSKAVNLSFLILLLAAPPTSQLAGVLSSPHDSTSEWVRYDSDFSQPPSVHLTWTHARGWMPQVAVNDQENQLLVTIVPPGQRSGQGAELWQYNLQTKEKVYWGKELEPRQRPLFTPWGPLFVTRDDDHKRVYLGKHLLFRKKAELWWPLALQDRRVFILSFADKRMRFFQMDLPSGKLHVLKDWGTDPVRDFSFVGQTVTYQRQISAKQFVVERLNLQSKKIETIAKFEQAWLAPLSLPDRILLSLSETNTRGRLVYWSHGQIFDGPRLGFGAPIPVLADQSKVLIRRQSESEQAYFVWDTKTDRVQMIDTRSQLLGSAQFLGGSLK